MTARKKAAKKKASKKALKGDRRDPRNIPGMKAAQWKPGQSGNPKGRPKGQAFQDIFLKIMEGSDSFQIGKTKKRMTRMEMVARIIIDQMIEQRDKGFIEMMLKRVWPEGVEVNLNAKGGFTIVFDDQDRRA